MSIESALDVLAAAGKAKAFDRWIDYTALAKAGDQLAKVVSEQNTYAMNLGHLARYLGEDKRFVSKAIGFAEMAVRHAPEEEADACVTIWRQCVGKLPRIEQQLDVFREAAAGEDVRSAFGRRKIEWGAVGGWIKIMSKADKVLRAQEGRAVALQIPYRTLLRERAPEFVSVPVIT